MKKLWNTYIKLIERALSSLMRIVRQAPKLNNLKGFLKDFKGSSLKKPRTLVYVALGIIILLAPLFWWITKHPKTIEAAWFDDTWMYRKAISIPTHTTAENNVYVTVPTFDATDTSKFQADCGDLRFTKQNGEILPYYVVDCDATANIHVNFDTLPAGASTYFMYYGNPSAPNGFEAADFANAASGLGTQTLAAEEKSVGPVAYWKFNEGYGTVVYNSSTAGSNGSFSGAPTWKSEDQCISGKCLNFDGSDDYVSGSISGSSSYTSTSISAWVKTTDSGANKMILGSGEWGFYINRFDSGKFFAFFDGSSGNNDSSQDSTTTINDGAWHHLSASNDGITTKIYVDGKQENSFAETYAANASNGFGIGANEGGSMFLAGQIDDVRIYNYALSSTQVKTLYNQGSAVQFAPSTGSP